MKKILFSDNALRGLLNFRGGVILFFAEKGHVIILVAPPDNSCDLSIFPPNVRHIPVELDRTGANPFRDFRYYNALKDIYRTEKPDYIFHYTIKPNIYGSIAAAHTGISSTAVIPGLGHVYNKDNLVNKVARVMYRFAMNYPDKVLVLNKDNFETFLERKVVKPDKLLLKGGEGVDIEKYRPAPPPHNKIPVFLMIARLLYEKGYTEYVRAAAALKNEAVFRIMGPIEQHPSAVPESSITDHCWKGYIEYIEYSRDVAAQISRADCIVLPSHHEGLSRILMEALAMGKPLIVTDIAGCRETVDHGKNGFLCRPKSSRSLISACRRFISLDSEDLVRMGRESRKKAETIFDENMVIAQYESILNE